ncbi:putative hydrolase of the HAD superfamily [Streptomyces griseochromogenes]|uniref:Hydrolase of the HAD superfamily n=1 Tax=Streptomyces griseochromogenes TaxID=68214 RepID=A0ABS4MAE0_9ACTN|nr:HAD hydrolase-like protein [Streptomyces griseochromogenes]MBP2056326.1 putative hydrolase of the HAD superfamily [Streptomyces griseochromogenes]
MQRDSPERTLLLDACGVVLGEPMEPLFRAVAASSGLHPAVVAQLFRQRFRDDLWAGRMDETSFWTSLAMACGLASASAEWRTVVDQSMRALPAVRRLPSWSRHARLVLISNHRHEWLVPRLEALALTGHFSEVSISSITGAVKPDQAAYDRLLGGTDLAQTLYVDDKLANVAAARSLGVRSLLADADGRWLKEVEAWLGC